MLENLQLLQPDSPGVHNRDSGIAVLFRALAIEKWTPKSRH